MPSYHYLHLDVFTDRPFTGNQLAVFLDASGLGPDTMQHIANEMAFPETTFVFPPESAGTDFRVRIFTPGTELPTAGHPTIGTTFALAHERRLTPGRGEYVLGLGVGPTRVRLEWKGDRLGFAWMTQPLPQPGRALSDIAALAHALGLREDDVRNTGLPAQEVSSGVPFLFVPLASRRAVNAVVVDQPALSRCYGSAGMPELPVLVFSLEAGDDDATIFSRMFAPALGIAEDPATGGASGPLGAYLVRHGAVPAERAGHMVSLQGVKMGRPSRIYIAVDVRDGLVQEVRIGGEAVLVGEGTLGI